MHILQEIQNDLRQHGTLNFGKLRIGSFSCHFSTTLIGKEKEMMKFAVTNFEKVKEYAKRFLQGQWTFLGFGEENWFGTLFYAPEGKLDLTITQMKGKFKDTVFQYSRVSVF